MKKHSLILFILLCVLCTCKEDESVKKIGVCPTINDPLQWKNGVVRYGSWQFGYTWIDGNYGIATGGAQVINIHNDCGCPIKGTETGGIGNTYAVYLPSDGNIAVVFRWKNNTFCELELYDGWKGATENLLRMHCLLGDFLKQYQGEFSVFPADSTQYDAYYPGNIHVTAWFTSKETNLGRLMKLIISAQ